MNIANFQVDVLICILQVSCTVIAGLCLLNLMMRVRSAVAAITGYTTVCVIVALTVAISLPVSKMIHSLAPATSPENINCPITVTSLNVDNEDSPNLLHHSAHDLSLIHI